MGVLEIALVAFAAMGMLTVTSATIGAILGNRRKIGSAKGFIAGLLLPLVGVGLVAMSRKKEHPDTKQRTQERHTLKKDAEMAAKEQFRRDNPQAVNKENTEIPVMKPHLGQSDGRVISRR